MNQQRVGDRMRNCDWEELLASRDINTVNNILETRILKVLDDEAPLRVRQIRKNCRNWVNSGLKEKMRDRDIKRSQVYPYV